MTTQKIIGLLLIVGGVLALTFGSFTYVKDSDTAKIGPLELSIKDKETINIPIWAGTGAVVFGSLLLVFTLRKK